MGVSAGNLEQVFTHHAPTADQQVNYEVIREAGKRLAEAILECTPPCADQQAAIRKVREAVMTANAAVALNGTV